MSRSMPQRRVTSANPDAYLVPKEGAYLAGMSIQALYERLHSKNPPPFKRRGRRYILPKAEFTEWANRDVIE